MNWVLLLVATTLDVPERIFAASISSVEINIFFDIVPAMYICYV